MMKAFDFKKSNALRKKLSLQCWVFKIKTYRENLEQKLTKHCSETQTVVLLLIS